MSTVHTTDIKQLAALIAEDVPVVPRSTSGRPVHDRG